jgi:hypothetical protein
MNNINEMAKFEDSNKNKLNIPSNNLEDYELNEENDLYNNTIENHHSIKFF